MQAKRSDLWDQGTLGTDMLTDVVPVTATDVVIFF